MLGNWPGQWQGQWQGAASDEPRGAAHLSVSAAGTLVAAGWMAGAASFTLDGAAAASVAEPPTTSDSCWGLSWGDSWGVSWGSEAAVEQPAVVLADGASAGGGGGVGSHRRTAPGGGRSKRFSLDNSSWHEGVPSAGLVADRQAVSDAAPADHAAQEVRRDEPDVVSALAAGLSGDPAIKLQAAQAAERLSIVAAEKVAIAPPRAAPYYETEEAALMAALLLEPQSVTARVSQSATPSDDEALLLMVLLAAEQCAGGRAKPASIP